MHDAWQDSDRFAIVPIQSSSEKVQLQAGFLPQATACRKASSILWNFGRMSNIYTPLSLQSALSQL
eukprot:1657941-Alexandrium_andersonii.AAC.1